MGYNNGRNILPNELIEQIQQYVDGENIYIPRKEEKRKGWGENSNAKRLYHIRDVEIYQKYRIGYRVTDLAEEYHLSTQAIYNDSVSVF